MDESDYFKRKDKLTIMNYETAFKCYEGLISKISSIRQWTITIMIALMIIILTNHISLSSIMVPVVISFSTLFILEVRARVSMSFNKDEILYLEKLFETTNGDEYKLKLKKYIFRDTRLVDISKVGRIKQIKRFISPIKKAEVLIWYGAWVIIWLLIVLLHMGGYNHFNIIHTV